MKTTALALVAVILSTLSGASLAASSAGALPPVSAVVSNVTGSTTLVSLDGQLTGKPQPRQATLRTASLWGLNEANGIAISDR